MSAFQETGERCKEIVFSTGVRMYHSCRDVYDLVCSELTEFDKFWTKKLKPKSTELKDQVVATLSDDSPLDPNDKKMRNTYMEFYFGVAVVLLGLIGGEYIGAAFDCVYPSAWWEVALIAGLPFYYWSQQTETFDDLNSRLSLFFKLFILGFFLGHVFPSRILNSVPASSIFLPFVFAAIFDQKLDSLTLYSTRTKLVGAAAIITFIASYSLMYLMGSLGFFAIIFILVHSALLYGHFSYVCEATKGKTTLSTVEKTQLAYIFALVFVQLVLTLMAFPTAHSHSHVDAGEHVHTEH